MMDIYPDLEWYAGISSKKGLTTHCPHAAAGRCPRYYQSLALLGSAGSTKIDEPDDRKLEAFWRGTDLWPLTAEQATTVSGPSDGQKSFTRFCPEVASERFGLFASDLFPYSDAETRERTLERLAASSGALVGKDYRLDWWRVQELHFSDCPLYALLPYVPPTKSAGPADVELLEMKPSVAGFTLNLKVLFTRLARWWLKRQAPK
jgi:hypothetical protein